MKALKFMLPVAALGLLASCSSEIDAPNPAPGADGEGTAFIGISLAAPSLTRAGQSDTKETGTSSENNIKDITMVLLDENGEELFCGNAETGAASDGNHVVTAGTAINAYFKVSEAKYNQLVANAGSTVTVKILANTGQKVWPNTPDDDGYYTYRGNTWNNNSFYFSGITSGLLAAPSEGSHEQESNAWHINTGTGNIGTVDLIRLAARFDLEASKDASYDTETKTYTATNDPNLTIEMVGMSIETGEGSTQYLANNRWFTEALIGNTPELTHPISLKTFPTYTYNLTASNSTVYAHPHLGVASSDNFSRNAFAAVQAHFTHAILGKDATGELAQRVYVWNGLLLGSLYDINNIDLDADDSAYAEYPTDIAKDIKTIILTLRDSKVSGEEIEHEDVLGINGVQYFENRGGYFTCYYAKEITSTFGLNGNFHRIDRNTIYKLTATKFSGIGLNSTYQPGDEIDTEIKDFMFDLNVEIADWDVEFNNWEF